jgi:hypothetical protein
VKRKKNTYSPKRFQVGSEGVCEAQLWKFSNPENQEYQESHMVAALSIHEALNYIRRREPDFQISKAECLGMIAMLSGSPLD